eukprot:CAMPEP_0185694580 /NCGR_PEP_ID=MMETSP1164-20130828/3988_1 /TAXON_ID=1104430 /ORGANISM="Chrysoreinhardia sp, Strain CCMP2950" /LENGTH=465 /DNA_ID=CAMNT_0028361423 /DNA_START=224 /DNA_END=1618 /DNA_ORIENTATION=-
MLPREAAVDEGRPADRARGHARRGADDHGRVAERRAPRGLDQGRGLLVDVVGVGEAGELDGAVVDGGAVEQDAEGGELDVRAREVPRLAEAAVRADVEDDEVGAPDGDGPEVVEDGVPDRVEHVRDEDGEEVVREDRDEIQGEDELDLRAVRDHRPRVGRVLEPGGPAGGVEHDRADEEPPDALHRDDEERRRADVARHDALLEGVLQALHERAAQDERHADERRRRRRRRPARAVGLARREADHDDRHDVERDADPHERQQLVAEQEVLEDRDEDDRRAAEHLVHAHRDVREAEHGEGRRREVEQARNREHVVRRRRDRLGRCLGAAAVDGIIDGGVVVAPRGGGRAVFDRVVAAAPRAVPAFLLASLVGEVHRQTRAHAEEHAPHLEQRVLERLLDAVLADAAHRQQDLREQRAAGARGERADKHHELEEPARRLGMHARRRRGRAAATHADRSAGGIEGARC